MSRILFIGDSHSSGYMIDNGPVPGTYMPVVWGDNNYAQIYCRENNIKGLIYACPGVGNDRYPDWVKFCLDMYPDVDTLVLQTTYWNRWMTSIEPSLNYEKEIPLDYFTFQAPEEDNCDRFIDLILHPKESNEQCPILFHSKTTPNFSDHVTNPPLDKLLPFEDVSYLQIKLFNELETFIAREIYLRNLFIIDRLCRDNGVKIKMWRMNNYVHIPEDLSLYGDLQIDIFRKPCVEFLKDLGYDNTEYMNEKDNEHYYTEYHELIARKFIPHLLEQ